jgi:hypothetical protein
LRDWPITSPAPTERLRPVRGGRFDPGDPDGKPRPHTVALQRLRRRARPRGRPVAARVCVVILW